MIEDAAAWMMRRAEYHGRDGRIGMLGISFGGGLSIVAAGPPVDQERRRVRDGVRRPRRSAAHAQVPCTGIQPDGTKRPPHDYGLAIVLLGAADRVVPAGQVRAAAPGDPSFLEASRLDMVDKAKAAAEFERAKTLETTLEEPSRTYMGYVNARDVARLGPSCCRTWRSSAAIRRCPRRVRRSGGAVYLLHGTDDNVVPAIESTLLARHAAAQRRDGARAADAAHHARRGGPRLDHGGDLAADRLLDGRVR